MRAIIVTNNPYVEKKLCESYDVDFRQTSYKGLLDHVKRCIERGHKLLSHPLSGSVKPNETPYKSVLISANADNGIDMNSLNIIIGALDSCEKFGIINNEKADFDFQIVDFSLIKSALESLSNCNV